jgi:hypothetical protein
MFSKLVFPLPLYPEEVLEDLWNSMIISQSQIVCGCHTLRDLFLCSQYRLCPVCFLLPENTLLARSVLRALLIATQTGKCYQ